MAGQKKWTRADVKALLGKLSSEELALLEAKVEEILALQRQEKEADADGTNGESEGDG